MIRPDAVESVNAVPDSTSVKGMSSGLLTGPPAAIPQAVTTVNAVEAISPLSDTTAFLAGLQALKITSKVEGALKPT